MKNLIKLFCLIILTLSVQSCATYSISTIGHEVYQEPQTVNKIHINFYQDYGYQIGYRPYRYNQRFTWYTGYQSTWYSYNYWGYNSYNPYHYYHPHTSGWLGNVYSNYNYGYTYGRRGSSLSRRRSNIHSNSNRTSILGGSTFNSRTLSTKPFQLTSPAIKKKSTVKPIITPRPTRTRTTKPVRTIRNRNTTRPVIRSGSSSRPNSNRRPIINKTQTKRSVQKTTTKTTRSQRNPK